MEGIIDVGSNSVRLNVFSGNVPIYRELITTRLGEGLVKDNRLTEKSISDTIVAISRFIGIARKYDANVHIFGTAAARRAENAFDLTDGISAVTGYKLHVLSGEEEAKIGFVGATANCKEYPALVVDIGGASTEIAVGTGDELNFSTSIDVGAVKVNMFAQENKVKAEEYVGKFIQGIKLPYLPKTHVAIGGTATAVAAILSGKENYDINVTDGFEIKHKELSLLTDRLFEMGLEGRKKLTAISDKRAEIIACGALILKTVMEKLNMDSITSSETDNLFGYLKIFTK